MLEWTAPSVPQQFTKKSFVYVGFLKNSLHEGILSHVLIDFLKPRTWLFHLSGRSSIRYDRIEYEYHGARSGFALARAWLIFSSRFTNQDPKYDIYIY